MLIVPEGIFGSARLYPTEMRGEEEEDQELLFCLPQKAASPHL